MKLRSLPNNLLPYDGEVYLFENLFTSQKSDQITKNILSEVSWRDDKITMFGKTYPQARKVAFHGDPGVDYIYTRIKMISPGWTPQLKKLNIWLRKEFQLDFNTALVNYYRDGRDHMSWHRDDEPELKLNPTIASLNFGASRDFFFRHNEGEKVALNLKQGDLLVMKGQTQTFWKHSLPKRLKLKEPRLNITFRKIY